MIKKEIWTEIGSRWPRETGYWDDWMRLPNVRHSRQDAAPRRPQSHAAVRKSMFTRRTVGGTEIYSGSDPWAYLPNEPLQSLHVRTCVCTAHCVRVSWWFGLSWSCGVACGLDRGNIRALGRR